MKQASEQQALPSQAGRGKRPAHPTRVGVVQASQQRAAGRRFKLVVSRSGGGIGAGEGVTRGAGRLGEGGGEWCGRVWEGQHIVC